MEHCAGGSLARRLQDEYPVDVQVWINQVVQWMVQLCDTLAVVHARGLVHHDIKPLNILLRDGMAVIADFGIVNTTGGTVIYSSPGKGLGLAAWLNPVFVYIIGMLFGQLFAIMPPVLAVPGVIAVLGTIILSANGWRLPDGLTTSNALFIGAQAALMLLLYFYIYHVFRTSWERARLVNELRAANEQLARAHEQQRELILLRERERMARDLHDGLGHSLVALSVQLEAVQRLYPVDPARASAQIDAMKQLTRDSMAELRRSLDALRAPDPSDESLDDIPF